MRGSKAGIRVLIVDDHKIVRVGLRDMLVDAPDLEVVGEAGTGREALLKIGALRPDVILLDTRLPDVSGLEVCRRIKDESVGSRVLILTSFADDNTILKAMEAGADGYLLKDIDETDIAAAIRRVHAGGVVMSPEAGQVVARGRSAECTGGGLTDELTGQERRVTELVAQGRTNKEVAVVLGLTEKTVRNYLSRAFEKLGVERRAQLAALLARLKGW